MKEKWNDRYSNKQFAYGEAPNNYLKEKLEAIPTGSLLFPAEGEGRNAVYAATLGWKADAFDLSIEGKKKAIELAAKYQVEINYEVGEFQSLTYQPNQFDAIALIYAHFPANVKSIYHKHLTTYLKKGGFVIFEAFSKNHLSYMAANEKMGGPKDIADLFSIDEIKTDFNEFEMIELKEQEIELNEGQYHVGKASVIRFFGRKK